MPYIAGYLLKLSLSLSVVYLFYILVLRRLTFYTWNRWYLLGYSFLAFFIPFVNISPVLEQSNWDKSAFLQFIPHFESLQTGRYGNESQSLVFAWWTYVLAGAVTGIMLMAIRFLVRYISYYRIRKGAKLLVDDEVKVYHVNKSIIPFSFGNAIFINRDLHAEDDLRQIIHHEFIHVKQKHTIDILWSELLCMLNWYNPFAWLIRKAIRQNLEFIADHKVLENGIDKKHYQYLLLKVTGAAHFSFTQQFNFSSLKKRIIMMNRSRSAKIQLTRFLFLLPLLSVLLLAFRTTVIENHRVAELPAPIDQDMQNFLKLNLIEAVTDTVPANEKKEMKNEPLLKKNPSIKSLRWENTAWSAGEPSLIVLRRDGTTEKYEWGDMQSRALFKKRYGMMPAAPEKDKADMNWNADTVRGVIVDASRNGPGNPYDKNDLFNALIVIDGVVQKNGKTSLNKLDGANIASMQVLKDEQALATYGDAAKGKIGVILITTKDGHNDSDLSISGEAVISTKDSTVLKGNPNITVRNSANIPVLLYVVDGIEFSPKEFEEMKLDPERIESITILKGESAEKVYGEKGKQGVIIIKLKKPLTLSGEPWDSDRIKEMFKGSSKVIWTINGNTYAVANNGHVFSMLQGTVNHVSINGKLYSVEEANRKFTQDQFVTAGAIDPQTVFHVHGTKVPALLLAAPGFDRSLYLPAKTSPPGQPQR